MKSEQPVQPFSEKMTAILNYGALNLAMAIGYRTGLFDVLDQSDAPQSASTISARAGLNVRYVTEWLGVMACGGIVELSADSDGTDLFDLPAEHGDLLARRAGHQNMGVYTQEIPLLTQCAFQGVVKGLGDGQGIPYANYPEFQQFMTQLADAKQCRVLTDVFLPSVDGGRLVAALQSGIKVCDIGCGEGIAVMLMAKAFPRSEFIGVDISDEVILTAAHQAQNNGIANASFLTVDAAALSQHHGFKASFDYVTAFDAIHDQTRPQAALKEIYAVLKPAGLFSMIDIAADSRLAGNLAHPMAAFLYTVSLMHCMPVGLSDGGMGLGMMWGRQKAVAMLRSSGFSKVDVTEIPEDSFNLHFLCRK